MCAQGGEKLFMNSGSFIYGFYCPPIKQLSVEAYNEADDWCRWESSCLPGLCGFIGSGFPLPGQHQREPHLLRELVRKMNSVPGRLRAQVRGHWGKDYDLGSGRF